MPPRSPSFDESAMPAGAIRAMMRSPVSEAVPMSLPSPRMSMPAPARPEQSMPVEMPAPQPNWQQAPSEWSALFNQGLGIMDKFRDPDFGKIINFDKSLSDLQTQNKDFYKQLEQIRNRDMNVALPADMDSYRTATRRVESGGDDSAVNPLTGAAGRYQILPSTAKALMAANPDLGLKIEDLKNPEVQEQLMKLYTDQSVKTLTPMLGRQPTAAELYLLHLLGHSGGPAVLRNLDAPISDTVDPAAIRSNPGILSPNKTGRQLLMALNKKFGG